MKKSPKIINADISFDDRGEIIHCNNFDFKKNNIKRFYINIEQIHQLKFKKLDSFFFYSNKTKKKI